MAKSKTQVMADFERDGISVVEWAERNHIPLHVAREVIVGRSKAKRGMAHRCAVLLGLKDGSLTVKGKYTRYVDGKPANDERSH
jgi:gp16 family phage-associated protein